MKKIFFLFISTLIFCSCSKKSVDLSATVSINFSHNWENIPVISTDFNTLKYTNASGEMLSIEQLRYVVSNVVLTSGNNEIYELSKYQLINVRENQLTITNTEVPPGDYNLSFVFGFPDNENTDGVYQNLNSVSFNVPGMLGGGYHYMQLDGKYVGQNTVLAPYNYHMIRAVNRTDPENLQFQDTSFLVNLGSVSITNTTEIEIKMNLAEWFQNPNIWDLNVLNTVLMPNFEAQIVMQQNGKSVFSLGKIN